MLRGLVFLVLVGGVGLGAWDSFPASSRSVLDWAASKAHATVCSADTSPPSKLTVMETKPEARAETCLPEDRFTVSTETLAAITCGPWDVSEDGIEAILQEMIRRGWSPPSGARALEVSRQSEGFIQAVDPDAPALAIAPTRNESGDLQSPENDAPVVEASAAHGSRMTTPQ
jgi:hypothetical protein